MTIYTLRGIEKNFWKELTSQNAHIYLILHSKGYKSTRFLAFTINYCGCSLRNIKYTARRNCLTLNEPYCTGWAHYVVNQCSHCQQWCCLWFIYHLIPTVVLLTYSSGRGEHYCMRAEVNSFNFVRVEKVKMWILIIALQVITICRL